MKKRPALELPGAGLGTPAKRRADDAPRPEAAEEAPVRNACIALLAKALLESDPPGRVTSCGTPLSEAGPGIASGIEEALYGLHGGCASREYKVAGRGLAQNLKRNPGLRARLLEGELEASQLVRLDWQQLSTEEQRAKDDKVQAKLLRMATMNDASQLPSDEYVCAKCSSRACSAMDAGRRDIGKCETWGAKGNDDRGRVITCQACSHRWEDLGLV